MEMPKTVRPVIGVPYNELNMAFSGKNHNNIMSWIFMEGGPKTKSKFYTASCTNYEFT